MGTALVFKIVDDNIDVKARDFVNDFMLAGANKIVEVPRVLSLATAW